MSLSVLSYCQLQNQLEFLTENVWEIRVPQSDKIEWAIVLCLLSKHLSEKIKHFINPEDNIEKIIESFNPFINSVSFFHNDILKNIVKNFKNKLQASTDNVAYQTEMDPKMKLKHASEFLSCNIHLFAKDMESYDTFSPCDTPSDFIILFKSRRGEVKNSFGLEESLCEKWRKDALENALSKINVEVEKFGKIWRTVKDSENFLIAILNSDERDIIEGLSVSPSVISKLIDAGFQLDPAIKDSNGRSAFYHALVSRKTNLCISVYHLGIFFCAEDGLSIRKPSKRVIIDLDNLQKTLCDDAEKLNEDNNDENVTILNSLISLRIEVNERIINILNGTSNQSNDMKIQEIEQQRDVLLNVLEIYSNNPYWKKKANLENYVVYKHYFDVIDVDVSLFFFDYIFKLQKNLKLANEYRYADVESSFFIFLLCHDIFNRRIKNCDYFKKLKSISTTSAFEIPFDIRKIEFDKIKHFYYDLINTAIDENVIRSNVPRKEIYYTLHEYPEIKNYFLIKRLTGYIKKALNIIERSDWKMLSVFIIERVLQVIGEFMKMEPDADFDIKWFLSLYLPKNVRKLFHDIRNNLSHFTSEEFTQKIHLEENDIFLFKGVEDDIRSMHDYLQPLLDVMLEKNIIHVGKILSDTNKKGNHSDIYKQTFHDNIPAMIQSILDVENECCPSSSFYNLINVFECVLKHLEEQFDENINEFNDCKSKNSEEEEIKKLKETLKPAKYLIELLKDKLELNSMHKESYEKPVNDILTKLEISMNLDNLNDFIDVFEDTINDCNVLISRMKTNKVGIKLKKLHNIEKFFRLLKPPSHSTNGDKESIKHNLAEKIRGDLEKRDKLVRSIYNNSMKNGEELSKLRISFLFQKEWNDFSKFYNKKENDNALDILFKFDPIRELETFFAKNPPKRADFDRFCRRLRLPDDDREKLDYLVYKRPKKKILSNRLSHLLNRIKHLEKVLIDEENEHMDLWTNKNRFLEKHIFNRYLEDENARMATEMLVLDCMNLFKKKTKQWEKSAGLFEGIDLRNVIAHQGIIIQNICEWFDPSDLPKDIIRIVIDFSKDKKAIGDILTLFKKANEDFNEFKELLKSEGREVNLVNEENVLLEKYAKYVDLLPGANVALPAEEDELSLNE